MTERPRIEVENGILFYPILYLSLLFIGTPNNISLQLQLRSKQLEGKRREEKRREGI
jgi:hypothetical protein